MEEIAYDITDHYPLPPKNVEWGEVSTQSQVHVVEGIPVFQGLCMEGSNLCVFVCLCVSVDSRT